ncbi:MAG: hypothetical protein B6D64_06540 [Bacteroidetes bacterium 4484_276]|nr:MAG: hypothetical protein B6D64_06540 [Bacteroidetes bacterium 4484_276]
MKTNYILIAILTFLLINPLVSLTAQEWTLTNPYPTFYDLRGVSFPSPDTGYVVGNNSLFLRTFDGGETWEKLSFPFSGIQINNINFLTNNRGYIASGHTIYATFDAGETWDYSTFAIWGDIRQTYFFNDTIGFAIGDYSIIAKTINSGESWQLISYTSQGEIIFNDIQFTNPETGYIVGQAGFFPPTPVCRRSDDGGDTWTDIEVPGEIDYVRGLAVIGPDEFWIGAGNTFNNPAIGWDAKVYHTTDGGETWTAHNVGISNRLKSGIERIKFFNSYEGRILNANHIYSTFDGGQTWEDRSLFGNENQRWEFESFSWPNHQTCILAGLGPTIIKTADGGITYNSLVQGHTNSLWSIHFTDSIHGCVGGLNSLGTVIYFTNDAGDTWHKAEIDTIPYGSRVFALGFSTPSIGWGAGKGSHLYKTTDGGESWTDTSTGFDYWLRLMSIPDSQNIYLGSTDGYVVKSSDQGNTWVDVSPMIQNHTVEGGFAFPDSITGYIALENNSTGTGKIIKTVNGGSTWENLDYGDTQTLVCMSFADKQTGIISLSNKKLLVTHDGGITWIESEINPPFSITYLKMFDLMTGVASIAGDYLAVTYDGGITFETVYEGFLAWDWVVNFSYFHDVNKGWGCGANGMIMRYDAYTTGIDTEGQNTNENKLESLFFPNPSTGELFILNPNYTSLTIVNMDGKLIKAYENNSGNKIDISGLIPGLYIVTVYSETSIRQQKLIKH